MATKRLKRARLISEDIPRHGDPARALMTLGSATYQWDRSTDRLTWGPSAAQVLGLPEAELPATGQAFLRCIEPLSGRTREDALSAGERAYDLEYSLRTGPGTVLPVQDCGRFSLSGDSIVRGSLRIDSLARDPALLPRRVQDKSTFLLRLQDDIAEAIRFRHGVTLILCSLSGETLPEGIDILRLARPLMRRRDHALMLSPHRLALVLTTCSEADSAAACARLGAMLAEDGLQIRLASASAPDQGVDACALLRHCERSLEPGASPSEEDGAAASESASLAVVRALNDRALEAGLRCLVDGHHRSPTLDRAVARMGASDLNGEALDPEIALLVDARMLEIVAEKLAAQQDARIILPVALHTLRNPEWLSVLAAHLGARPGIASRLTVALPESALLETSRVLGRLDAMKALGVGIALEGFGGGFATASHLRHLPIDLVIIDGVFVATLARSIGDRHFVRTLIDIAQQLGIAVAAEWVDDEATAEKLALWGVDYMEGGLFGETVRAPRMIAQRMRA